MAREVRSFAVTVPAGTPQATPQVTQLSMPPREVVEVEVLVPPGPRGEVGFRIGSSGTQLLPVNVGQWTVTDDEVIHWPLEGQHDSGSWEFTAYNTGLFAHTITVRFLVTIPYGPQPIAAAPIAPELLGAVPLAAQPLPAGAIAAGQLTLPPLPLPLPPPPLPIG